MERDCDAQHAAGGASGGWHDGREWLAGIAAQSLYGAGINRTIEYSFRVFARFLRGGSLLKLGPAEGIMIEHLAHTGLRLTPVLEPVEVPVLRRAAGWLAPGAPILAASRSLHRQAAVLMGLPPLEEALNDLDCRPGHRRGVFNPETFRHAFLETGLTLEAFAGYWVKPLANRRLEQTWSPKMTDAFMALGSPDVAAEICVVAGRGCPAVGGPGAGTPATPGGTA